MRSFVVFYAGRQISLPRVTVRISEISSDQHDGKCGDRICWT